jgi:nitrite reductase/ring-hydroxylating ferredoxin subunit
MWHAVEHCNTVTSRPHVIELGALRYVLFRDSSGTVLCFADYCPHRRASFALGWTEADQLRCPYHGWSFDRTGRCVKIPAEATTTTIPAKARLNPCTVAESDGFIWLLPDPADAVVQGQPPPKLPQVNLPSARWPQTQRIEGTVTLALPCSAVVAHLLSAGPMQTLWGHQLPIMEIKQVSDALVFLESNVGGSEVRASLTFSCTPQTNPGLTRVIWKGVLNAGLISRRHALIKTLQNHYLPMQSLQQSEAGRLKGDAGSAHG